MKSRLISLVALGALLAVPALADTVYLKNGRTFEGVIADSSDSVVRIRMPGATLSLPAGSVARVEKSEAPFAVFLARRDALRRNPSAGAADWLQLSSWARRNDLAAGAREAALMAADLDPHAAGLAPVMRSLGFVLDEQLDRFVSYGESMRRKGFVFADGEWITPAEHRERQAQREAADARARTERLERETRRAEARRDAELAELREASRRREERERQQAESQAAVVPYPYGASVFVMPGFFVPEAGVAGSVPAPHHHARHDDGFEQFQAHQPGSLLPGLVGPHFSNSRW